MRQRLALTAVLLLAVSLQSSPWSHPTYARQSCNPNCIPGPGWIAPPDGSYRFTLTIEKDDFPDYPPPSFWAGHVGEVKTALERLSSAPAMEANKWVFGLDAAVENPTKTIRMNVRNMGCGQAQANSNGDARTININSCWLEKATHYDVLSTLLHELGHFAGLGEVYSRDCSDQTIMYFGPTSRTTLSECDHIAIDRRLNRRDSDGDGWIDDEDCDPYNPWVHPEAGIYCNQGREEADDNCNGIPDWNELGCLRDYSPLLVSTSDRPIHLTDAAHGVLFDLDGDGVPEQLSWTLPDSDDAWLALDRDGNGRITNGGELFGNFSPQPAGAAPNGFLALTEYDLPEHGGNNDGVIDRHDAVWAQLRLWTDVNHDGVSQASELRDVGGVLSSISLDFRQRARRDQHGNVYRYWAKVTFVDATIGWISDVYLVRDH